MLQSPLRYPGGKAKLYPFFAALLAANHSGCDEYCEPYAGGAGLAIKLLANGFFQRICINDVDRSIYAFWKSALEQTDDFCSAIARTDFTIEEWHRQKLIWQAQDTADLLRLGFATYFLNRTNRSGIIEGAGPIGGYKQEGTWKIDVRVVKSKQISNLRALSRYARSITITNLDAHDFIKSKSKSSKAFLYLDPPYFVKGHKLYKNSYTPKDHLRVANLISSLKNRQWVVSYDACDETIGMYSHFRKLFYNPVYSAGSKSFGSEVIFVCNKLNLPSIDGFDLAA